MVFAKDIVHYTVVLLVFFGLVISFIFNVGVLSVFVFLLLVVLVAVMLVFFCVGAGGGGIVLSCDPTA